MGFGKTSSIALVISLAILIGEFWLIFNGSLNPAKALLEMAITLVNGVILAFALLLLIIGLLLVSN